MPGTHQVCVYCNPPVSTFALDDETGVEELYISSARYTPNGFGSAGGSDVPSSSDWSNMTTLQGEDGQLIYVAVWLPHSQSWMRFEFNFVGASDVDPDLYFWFLTGDSLGTSPYYPRYSLDSSLPFNDFLSWDESSDGSYSDSLGYLDYWFSGRFSDSGSFNQISFNTSGSSSNSITYYFSDFRLATYEYGGTPPPPPPGFEDEDGWLGGLIKAIIEGIQKIIDGITNLPENIANAVKGFFDMVVNAIVQLGQTILDGLKSLFIPSDGYFEGVAADMQAWLEDHLGLLVYPFTLVADLASRIAAVEGGEPTAHIPEIAYTDGGDKYVLIAEQEVNLYDQVGRNETFIELHQLYLMAMDAAIGGTLAFLAWKKFDQITGGSST